MLSRAVSGGKRVGSLSALGVAAGEVLHTLLAVLGLATLFQASTAAFVFLKYVGAAYLVYLGIRALREGNALALRKINCVDDFRAFRQGVLTNLFNPKAVLFFVSFLPQFVNTGHGHVRMQLLILGLTFAFLDVIFLSILAGCAGQIGMWLTRKPQRAQRIRWGTGGLLMGLGVRLAFTEKN